MGILTRGGELWVVDFNYNLIRRLHLDSGSGAAVEIENFDISAIMDYGSSYSLAHDGVDLWYSDWDGPIYRLDDGITENPPFLSLSSTGGTLSSGNFLDVSLSIDASGLDAGQYQATIVIDSNDPDESRVEIPVDVTVTASPSISPSPNFLDFGGTPVGESADLVLSLTNVGDTSLTVSDIASDSPEFSADPVRSLLPWTRREM